MDPQIRGALLDVFNRGRQLSYTPYNPYQFATVAPMSPFQQQGMQATVDAANAGVGQREMQDAINAARDVAQYRPGNLRGMDVTAQGPIDAVDAGKATGMQRASAGRLGTRFTPGTASVGSVDTSINAGDVSASPISAAYGVDPARINQAQALDRFKGSISGGAGDRITGAITAPTVGTITSPTIRAGDKVNFNEITETIAAPNAPTINAPTVQAGDRVSADQVNAGSFADTNIDPYMSRFQTGVIDAALGDIERQRKIQQNQNKAAAVAGGAFGGDRQAILEAETNRAALEQSARTAAQLRQSGFESAARLAEADLARQTDAARANQQANLQAGLANQATGLDASKSTGQLGLQGQIAQAEIGMRGALSAQDANLRRQLANQQSSLQADLANQATGLDASKAGGQLGLQAQTTAAQLGLQGALAAQDANLRRQLANQQVSVGDAERAMQASSTMAANQLQNRQQELQRRMSNVAQANEMNRANLNARMQQQQLRQGALTANQDAALRAQLANQQTALAEGQAANQGRLQTQALGAQASRANQDARFQAQQLGAQQARANQQAALQASLANQQNQRLYGFQNQDAALQAQLANQRTALEQARLDQARRFQNQDASFQRQLAQQNLGLQGAAQRLAGAQQLAGLGQDMRGLRFADAAALQGVGDTQRQFAQQLLDDQYRRFQEAQNYPFRMFDVLRSGAGMLPNPTMTSSRGRNTSLGLPVG